MLKFEKLIISRKLSLAKTMENDQEFISPSKFSTINTMSNSCFPPSSMYEQLGFGGLYMQNGSSSTSSSSFEEVRSEIMNKISVQEIKDARAKAASRSHSEAERRRRERINGHLGRLRSILPNTMKTDKATLLAEVIQHVKELKRQASNRTEGIPLPTELDELTVNTSNNDQGQIIIKASICCEDRISLIPDLVSTLKSLKLRILKAEITALGGRVKNTLVVTGDNDSVHEQLSVPLVQEALKLVLEKGSTELNLSGVKRLRHVACS